MLLLKLENIDSIYCIDLGKQKLSKTAEEASYYKSIEVMSVWILWLGPVFCNDAFYFELAW